MDRYVDVLWFVFHVYELLWIMYTHSCYVSKFMMKHTQKLD